MWRCSACGHEYNPLEAHYTSRDRCPECGSTEIEKTRSSLIVEWLRFLHEKKPRFALYENVKNLVGAKFRQTFDLFVKELEDGGYNVYWQVLDAKNQGIPQHRERVYCIVIRKDMDNGRFRFPDSIPLRRSLYDMCERQVDEKYYLPDEKVSQIITVDMHSKGSLTRPPTDMRENLTTINVGNTNPSGRGMNGNVYDASGVGPTLTTNKGEGPKIRISDGSDCIIRVRKLIPKECWRLMGFEDSDFCKAQEAMNTNIFKGKDRSGTQLYKQAGNSIVVDVLLHIFENLYDAMPYLFEDIHVGSFFSGIGAFEKALTLLGEPREELTGDAQPDQLKQIGYINECNSAANRVYDSNIARNLVAEAGGGGAKTGWYRFPNERVNIKQATKKGFIECEVGGAVDLSYPNSKTRRGRVQENGRVCPTITAQSNGIHIIEKRKDED